MVDSVSKNIVWRNSLGRFYNNNFLNFLDREWKRWIIDWYVCVWDGVNNFIYVNIIRDVEYIFWKEGKWFW